MLFYMYWVLMWGVANGELLVSSWGNNFALIVVQDLTAVECLQILIVNILAMVAVRPQLQYIYNVLKNTTINYVQDNNLDSETEDLNLSQHLQPTCRAAKLPCVNKLVSSRILRCLTDQDIANCKQRKMSILKV
jgi:hypothetical protein